MTVSHRPTSGQFDANKRMAGLALITSVPDTNPFIPKKMVLLGLRDASLTNGNTWTIPGGSVDDGESIEASALREFYEETGFTTDNLPIDPMTIRPASAIRNAEGFFTTIIGEIDTSATPPHTGKYAWETQEFKWFPLDELDKVPNLHPQLYEALPGIRAMADTQHLFEVDNEGQAWLVGYHFTPTDYPGRPKVTYHDEISMMEKDRLAGTSFGGGLYIAPDILRDSYKHYGRSGDYSGSYEWRFKIKVDTSPGGMLEWERRPAIELIERLAKLEHIQNHTELSSLINQQLSGQQEPPFKTGKDLYTRLSGQFGYRGANHLLLSAGCHGNMDNFCYVSFDPENDMDWSATKRTTLLEPTPPLEILRKTVAVRQEALRQAEEKKAEIPNIVKSLPEEQRELLENIRREQAVVDNYGPQKDALTKEISDSVRKSSLLGKMDTDFEDVVRFVHNEKRLLRNSQFFETTAAYSQRIPFGASFTSAQEAEKAWGALAKMAVERGTLAALETLAQNPGSFGKLADSRSFIKKLPFIGSPNPYETHLKETARQMLEIARKGYAKYDRRMRLSPLFKKIDLPERAITQLALGHLPRMDSDNKLVFDKDGCDLEYKLNLLSYPAYSHSTKKIASLYERQEELTTERYRAEGRVEEYKSSFIHSSHVSFIPLRSIFDIEAKHKAAVAAMNPMSTPEKIKEFLTSTLIEARRYMSDELKQEAEQAVQNHFSPPQASNKLPHKHTGHKRRRRLGGYSKLHVVLLDRHNGKQPHRHGIHMNGRFGLKGDKTQRPRAPGI